MSYLLLIILIIISLIVAFRNNAFQSEIKNSTPLKQLFTINLSYFKQFNLSESDKFLLQIKSAAKHLSKSNLSHNGNWKINTAAEFLLNKKKIEITYYLIDLKN